MQAGLEGLKRSVYDMIAGVDVVTLWKASARFANGRDL